LSALQLQGITKIYGHRPVLRQVTLQLQPGEMAVLTGDNGAGKTTLLKVVAGLIPPSRGRIEGISQRYIGYVGHRPMIYEDLTVAENLAFFAGLYGEKEPGRIPQTLERIGLQGTEQMPGRVLSRGMLQRLSLGRVLMQQPRLFLMDEPFTGLDSQGRQWLTGVLRRLLQEQAMVLLVSHQLQELADLPYAEYRLQRGRLV